MNPDGTERKKLTDNQAYDTSPTYSPSGKEIAFVSQREGQESGKVYTMNAEDGSGQRNLSGSRMAETPPTRLTVRGLPSWARAKTKTSW